jgi:glutamate synthase (ferredoxin)
VERHAVATGSARAAALLDRWDETLPSFVKIMPRDYRRMLDAIGRFEAEGATGEEAIMAAFEENRGDKARAGGN